MPQIDPNTTLLLIAIFNCITAILSWRTHAATKKTQENVQKIETATNSMKDALVKSTAEASHAAGMEEGRVAGEAAAATFAKGKLDRT